MPSRDWSTIIFRLQLTTNEKDVLQSSTQYGEEKRVFNEDFYFKVIVFLFIRLKIHPVAKELKAN